MTKSGWNRSKHVEAISLRSVARRKKERKKEETSKIQYPAGVSGRVKIKIYDKTKHKEQATKLERIMACQASEVKRLIDLYGAANCAVSPQGYTQLLRSP